MANSNGKVNLLVFDDKLRFETNIDTMVTKAFKMLNFISMMSKKLQN